MVPATAAATPAPASIELSASGQRALKQSSLSVASVPRGPKKTTLWLGPGKTTIGSSATVELIGSLRFTAGKRKVDATALELALGRTSSSISGKVGKQRVKLFAVTPTRPAELDAAAGRLALTRAKIALTPAAAKALRSTLKLKRTPSTAALGTFSVAIAPELGTVPAPTPIAVPAPGPSPTVQASPTPESTPIATPTVTATPTATATATPSATATPGPALDCAQRFDKTPAGVVDWFGCALPGSTDLKSWTNYLQMPFPQFPCPGSAGSIVPGFGASQVVAGDKYDHRFPVLSSEVGTDGSATVVLGGNVTYTLPVHGINEQIGSLRVVINPGGLTGTVYADGYAKPFDTSPATCTAAPTPYTGQPVLSLNLTGITPVTTSGVTRWISVPATVIDTGDRIGGGSYDGSAWGTFTIALPTR
ncbi:HtaA domain-containing protein [Solirubrobacter phytolaccae]|uniref:HtaA domain-containing protein n=1 Tax=Solirubrobacter phytolaccae TaxID=1404360 RepID=A0A9X3N3F8_9ACTN|nr:HtaA domain-containing protein [Solirubrobacter phytolaccae]MDA0179110.1 HtaA domain-containing protein [Solirubrobacter phytolaccae]